MCDFPKLDSNSDVAYSWAWKYFDAGACRYAYKGIVNRDSGPFKEGERIVVKKWKNDHIFASEFWKLQIDTEKEAQKLVEEWNRANMVNKEFVVLSSNHVKCTKSTFTITDNDHRDKVVVDEKVLAEKWLDGNYEKWNSNNGWKQHEDISVQAFCHWTYHYTDGNYLFCDAQGTRGEKYYITDPCISSKSEGRFGVTDGGALLQNAWFAGHVCNQFCHKNWKKPKEDEIKAAKNLVPSVRRTSYTWDITDTMRNSYKYRTVPANKLSTVLE